MKNIIDIHKRVYVGDKLICGVSPEEEKNILGPVILDYDTRDGANHKFTNYTLGVKKFTSFTAPREITKFNKIDTNYLTEFKCNATQFLESINISLPYVKNGENMFLGSGIATAKVNAYNIENISSMLRNCRNLTEITFYCPQNARIKETSGAYGMFNGCQKLAVAPHVYVTDGVLGRIFGNCQALTEFTYLGDPAGATIQPGAYRNVPETGVFKYDNRYDYSKLITELPVGWTKTPVTVPYVTVTVAPSASVRQILLTFDGNSFRPSITIDGGVATVSNDYYAKITSDVAISTINLTYMDSFRTDMLKSSNPIRPVSILGSYLNSLLKDADFTGMDLSRLTTINFKQNRVLTSIKGLKNAKITSLKSAFEQCPELIEVGAIDVEQCADGTSAFRGCRKLNKLTLIGNPQLMLNKSNMMFNTISATGEIKYDNRFEMEYNELFSRGGLPIGWVRTPIDINSLP